MAAETLIQVEAAEAGFWISNIIPEIYNLKQMFWLNVELIVVNFMMQFTLLEL